MDPCGHICAVGTRPYACTVRPFRDSSETARIVWYEVPETNPVFPWPSVFTPRILQGQWPLYAGRPVYPDDLGEPIGVEREIVWSKPKPEAIGEHICGTPEDFLSGCRYLPDDPPVLRRDDGLPLCCGLAIVPDGGVGLGGESPIGVVVPGPPGIAYFVPSRFTANVAVYIPADPAFTWKWTGVGGVLRTLRSPSADPMRPYWWVEWVPEGTRFIAVSGAAWDGQGVEDFNWDPTSAFPADGDPTRSVNKWF